MWSIVWAVLVLGCGAPSGEAPVDAAAILEEARADLAQRRFAVAAQKLRALVERDPRSVAGWTELGRVLAADGALEEASSCLDRAVSLAPDAPDVRHERAHLLLGRLGRPEQAEDDLRRLLLAPADAPVVDPAVTVASVRAEARLDVALLALQRGELGLGIDAVEAWLVDPDRDARKEGVARAALRKAQPAADRAATREHGDTLDDVHRRLLYAGRPGDARVALQQLLTEAELGPADQWAAEAGVGMSYALQGQADKALPWFERAAATARPLSAFDRAQTAFNLACAGAESGRADDALSALEELLWLAAVVHGHPRPPASHPRWVDAILADDALAPLRGRPELDALLGRYAVVLGAPTPR